MRLRHVDKLNFHEFFQVSGAFFTEDFQGTADFGHCLQFFGGFSVVAFGTFFEPAARFEGLLSAHGTGPFPGFAKGRPGKIPDLLQNHFGF